MTPLPKPADVVRRWYETRDSDCLNPDIVWNVLETWPAGGRYVGRDAVLQTFFPRLLANFAEYGAEAEALWETGDVVVSAGFYRGRVRQGGPLFAARFVHLWTVRDGQIVGFDQVADTAVVRAALSAGAT